MSAAAVPPNYAVLPNYIVEFARMRRTVGILFGVGTQLFFLATVWQLFAFLSGNANPAGPLWIDALLAGQFAVVHSLLLQPKVRRRLEPIVGSEFYGSFYALATCGGLWLMFLFWRSDPHFVWRVAGWPALAVEAAFFGAWLALFYSLWLTGLGYQTGLTPWWHWLRGRQQPRREFAPRGAHLFLRHPVYLSFLGLVWLRPEMSVDRGVLLAIWTIYIFTGSVLKDRRMVHYLGDRYRAYQARVAGYPGMPWGPLARIPQGETEATDLARPLKRPVPIAR